MTEPIVDYLNETELLTEFKTFMSNPDNVELATQYLFDSLIDEAILGVVFEMHYTKKMGGTTAMEGEPENSDAYNIIETADNDVFGTPSNAKKAFDCTCPNCDRPVAASRFAPHLEKCMGMGRNSSRIASRRIASAREGTTYFPSTGQSDDEDDADWSGDKRKKSKMQPVRTNGSKKNGKSS